MKKNKHLIKLVYVAMLFLSFNVNAQTRNSSSLTNRVNSVLNQPINFPSDV